VAHVGGDDQLLGESEHLHPGQRPRQRPQPWVRGRGGQTAGKGLSIHCLPSPGVVCCTMPLTAGHSLALQRC
jgi:hypothetical protein